MLHNPCIVGGPQPQAGGAKSEVAASPLPCRRPKREWKCSITHAFSGVPNHKRGQQNLNCPPPPVRALHYHGPKSGRKCCIFSGGRNSKRGE